MRPSSPRLLNVGFDPPLLNTRTLLLRAAGYSVDSADSLENAVSRLRTGSFALVILCHSIPEHDRQHLIAHLRAQPSSARVLFIASNTASAPEPLADLTIGNHPITLLSTLEKELSQISP